MEFCGRCWSEEGPVACINEIGVYLTFLKLSPQLHLTFRGEFKVIQYMIVPKSILIVILCLTVTHVMFLVIFRSPMNSRQN